MYWNFEVKLSLEIRNRNWILDSWERSFKRIEKLQTFSNMLAYLFRLYVWIYCDIVMSSFNIWIQNSIPIMNKTDSTLYNMIIDCCMERLMKKTAVLLISTVFVFFNGELEITCFKLFIKLNEFDIFFSVHKQTLENN